MFPMKNSPRVRALSPLRSQPYDRSSVRSYTRVIRYAGARIPDSVKVHAAYVTLPQLPHTSAIKWPFVSSAGRRP